MATAAAAPAKTATTAVAVQIIGQGTLSASGLPFVLVGSKSEPGRTHVVAYAYEGAYVGARIRCDCVAASYGRSCTHVLVALAWLSTFHTVKSSAHKARREARKGKEELVTPRAASTGLGSAHVKRHVGIADASERDTAILRRSQKPFSLMK